MATAAAAANRENARRPDGKFGEQAHAEAGLDGQLDLENFGFPSQVAGHPVITVTSEPIRNVHREDIRKGNQPLFIDEDEDEPDDPRPTHFVNIAIDASEPTGDVIAECERHPGFVGAYRNLDPSYHRDRGFEWFETNTFTAVFDDPA